MALTLRLHRGFKDKLKQLISANLIITSQFNSKDKTAIDSIEIFVTGSGYYYNVTVQMLIITVFFQISDLLIFT
jgi:hypothetical protein